MSHDEEPAGLYMSLEDIIKTGDERRQKERAERGHQQRGRRSGARPPRQQQQGWAGQHPQPQQHQQQFHVVAPIQQQQPFGQQPQIVYVAVAPQAPPPPRGPPGGGGGYGKQPRRGSGGGGGGRGYGLRPPRDLRADESCCEDAETGDVVFKFKRTELVRISPAGAVTLTSGGYHTNATLAALNDGLNLLGIRVTAPAGDAAAGDWSISDGRSLARFYDGVVLPAKGPQHTARGQQLLQAFASPNRGLAAAATAASNAAATAAGILPHTGHVPPRVAVAAQQQQQNGGGGSVFARLGGAAEEDARTRRLKAQGRYAPY
eukprot:scaffold1.g5879.t1